MKIEVRSENTNFSMPVPLAMADVAIKAMPEAVFARVRRKLKPPYDSLFTKEIVSMMFGECRDVFRQNKGLEIIHVEGHDGTYISVVL